MKTLFDIVSASNSIAAQLETASGVSELNMNFADITPIEIIDDSNPLRSISMTFNGVDAVELPETKLLGANHESIPSTMDWVPRFKDSILLGGASRELHHEKDDIDCKSRITYSASTFNEETKKVSLVVTNEESHGFMCSNSFLFYTHQGFFTKSFTNSVFSNKAQKWTHELDYSKASEAEIEDIKHNGVRMFQLRDSIPKTLKNLVKTLELFVPALITRSVPDFIAKRNVRFLKDFRKWDIQKLDKALGRKEALAMKSKIRTGDMIGILRLDGLDPLLSIGMGSNTGHVVVAAWLPKRYVSEMMDPKTHGLAPTDNRVDATRSFDLGEYEGEETDLFMIESTAKDVYWDVNGIQATSFEQWVEWAAQADYNSFVAPISDEHHERINSNIGDFMTWFSTIVGADYGYSNFLMSWLDDVKNNFPCIDGKDYHGKPYKWCTNYHHLELLVLAFEKFLPSMAQKLMLQAVTLRAGSLTEEEKISSAKTNSLSFSQAVHRARTNKKIESNSLEIFTIPEDDSWRYVGTRFDVPDQRIQSNVCCVFVCNFYKHTGLFDGKEVNCSEFTNRDITGVEFYHKTQPAYSLIGKYNVMPDNGYNTRKPYDHMFESCPTVGPNYEQPERC